MTLRPEGLYCPAGDFFVDPVVPVDKAIITHGHADHARPGHRWIAATRQTLDIMAIRYGTGFASEIEALDYDVSMQLGDIEVSLHPAGHVLGSAQVRISDGRLVVVASGDYKRQEDPTCTPFSVVPCDIFITEATFALPVFRLPSPEGEIAKLLQSMALFSERTHMIGAYSLGKAQRVIALMRQAGYTKTIYVHGALEKLTEYYRSQNIALGPVETVDLKAGSYAGELVLCPPGQLSTPWSRRFVDPVTVFASGWSRVRARARQRGAELPLVISDHAGWEDLCRTVLETGAREIWVTHGAEEALVHWCKNVGLRAFPLNLIGYGDDDDSNPPTPDVNAN
ncbi:MAG: ligase-associated DNA damage response exonuclease [Stappiaceae bacterium]